MAAKLKVYATRIGFHDVVVAAPNQKAALAAWDVGENLFAQGAASVSDDPKASAAALAQPGVVLSRAIGETGPYHAEAKAPAAAPKAARAAKPKKAAAAPEPKARKARPRPDRGPLRAAERALADLDAEARRADQAIQTERRALDAREAGEQRALATRRRRLERERDRLLRVYNQATHE